MTPISPFERWSSAPRAEGLYDPAYDRDACGLAMVATLRGTPGHDIVEKALGALRNLEHRGAVGSDAGTGDGAGIITQVPHLFFDEVTEFVLPPKGFYAVGTAFLPADSATRQREKAAIEAIANEEGLRVVGWREVPHRSEVVGDLARAAMPFFEQLFVESSPGKSSGQALSGLELDRLTFRLRKRAERELGSYFPSLSSRTLVYKGMVTTLQLEPFYPDLSDPRFQSTLALVHSRYSTNTFPSWPLAQPFRMIAHNGEINTIRANRNWMRARQSQLQSDVLGDLRPLFPIVSEGGSDSASLDEVVELLTLAGRSLPHAIMMMVPEAWENQLDMDESTRAFYEYHSMMMEPWDGPAALVFTDGSLVGATLDRNGLRPGRYVITSDGLIILASEIGVLDIDPSTVVRKGRLRPGAMLLADTVEGRLIEDQELKQQLAHQEPWAQWIESNRIELEKLPEREHIVHTPASVIRRQRTFGYTEEEVRVLLTPMGQNGAEPLGAMGSDTPIAAISDRPRLLFDYFTQQFAQVTNPPLDSIREAVVTSMRCGLGPERNLLAPTPAHAAQVTLEFPVIDNDELVKIEHLKLDSGEPATVTLSGLYRVDDETEGLEERLRELCEEADRAVDSGVKFLVLSDRDSTADLAPIPSLLMLSAVHHHLIRGEKRMQVGIVVESGDVREVHHVALLIGFGASAVNPYLAMETVEFLVRQGDIAGIDSEKAVYNVITALGKGVLKIMSKMGISTVASYAGAQAFEAVGLSEEFVAQYFTGTTTILGGVGLDIIADENRQRHRSAYPLTTVGNPHSRLAVGGEYQWRREGPPHLFNPETVFKLQHATRSKRFDVFREYTQTVDDQSERLMTLRGLFSLKTDGRPAIPIEQVEPASEIIRRFTTGAMSMGAISPEMHETLAVAMNELGGRSNTGEGGESPERLRDPRTRSKIKQVASGRFGVTSFYLTMADDLQIKMAQGAKPGEGGQLPANKVYPWIAALRYGTPGVGLISPPPHHDIYSIEDLKQLIFDLKRSNPAARVHVKLVSQSGIGAVATGVAKAKADVVLISGHDGGTGASPLNSLKHAGTPWEIGLAEAQQTLVRNNMRGRVTVQVDGQMKTGRDVIIAALLGAEEFGFATAPMVVSGCILMRVCHLDTCPVGVASQNPALRARFTGSPEFVKTFFEFLAEEVREYLAQLGFRSLGEAIGQVQLLDVDRAIHHWKADGLDLSPILSTSHVQTGNSLARVEGQDHDIESHFDQKLIQLSAAALTSGASVVIELPISNTERAVGTMLGHEVTKAYGEHGLPAGTIDVSLTGAAGQSLGAFLPGGITLRLSGDANDYVGKGLSGGEIVLRPAPGSLYPPERNVIAGNVIGYGATSGTMFISGVVGERFLVRNSGATAVVEGVGDHALEYMTGGLAVILGETGRNLGAGMSGGTAYVWRLRPERINREAISSGELEVGPLGSGDVEILVDLLQSHLERTGSPVAQRMLADQEAVAREFVKVTPRDYQAVLRTREQAEDEGLDPNGDVVWGRILEVTGG
jgi:glutamate synthase (NADPH/NADH) large chain